MSSGVFGNMTLLLVHCCSLSARAFKVSVASHFTPVYCNPAATDGTATYSGSICKLTPAPPARLRCCFVLEPDVLEHFMDVHQLP